MFNKLKKKRYRMTIKGSKWKIGKYFQTNESGEMSSSVADENNGTQSEAVDGSVEEQTEKSQPKESPEEAARTKRMCAFLI